MASRASRSQGTPSDSQTQRFRVQRAAELLESTEEKVAAVGAACGFQEMSYFARTFRALKGKPPSRYRAERRAASGEAPEN